MLKHCKCKYLRIDIETNKIKGYLNKIKFICFLFFFIFSEPKDADHSPNLERNYENTNDVLENTNNDLSHDPDHTDCPCALNGPSKESSKMLNPIYIAVPVAGVCVLLALVIFAMYLLRRRTDYYERYNYPRNVTVPPCHVIGGAKQNASPCKINRCTDSERSSASSETRLFL